MQRLASLLRSPFSFLFARSSTEERVAAYVIREHGRGRGLGEILEDRYVQNRLTPQQRARTLDRRRCDCDIPRCEPVGLEDDDVVGRLTARQLAADDLVQLVHLEPVEHAGLDWLDQVRRLDT